VNASRRGIVPPVVLALLVAVQLAAAPVPTIRFGKAQALTAACPGQVTFTGLVKGMLPDGKAVDLDSASLELRRPKKGVVEIAVAGSGLLGGERVNELGFVDRIGDGNDPLAAVYAALRAPHALARWLGGRAIPVGKPQKMPRSVLQALGGAKSGHVVVEPAAGGARLRFLVLGGRVGAARGELLVDPATWWPKSALVDVEGEAIGRARAFAVCR
jgi:hypothetical protein